MARTALANFGTVKFQNCVATLKGKIEGIGGFGSKNLVDYKLYNSTGKDMLASTGALTDTEAFSVEFLQSS
jgi:hypothetical protein